MRILGTILACAVAATAATGCAGTKPVAVSSTPDGARILVDGEDYGDVTGPDPVLVELDMGASEHTIGVSKAGHNTARRRVVRTVKHPGEVAGEGACAVLLTPCCFVAPVAWLGSLVDPGYYRKWEPSRLHFTLERTDDTGGDDGGSGEGDGSDR